jgi:hypothetical protein
MSGEDGLSAAKAREVMPRGIERRRMPASQSPRHPDFPAVVLAPLAERRAAGEPADELSLALYKGLHTWAVAFAGAQCARLPGHADRNEVLSQVLRLTWDACRRIDWDRYEAWPAFLESKVSRARIEAARSDDWLSRRERVRRRHFQDEVARLEQVEQRTLTSGERQAVARAVAPDSTRVGWAKAVLESRHPSTVADVPEVTDVVFGTTVEDEVEEQELGRIRASCLAKWLAIVKERNEPLAADVSQWLSVNDFGDRDLPARLAHRLEPYTPLLLAMLGEAA